MDITEFETNLNELIQAGCTEISACYVGDGKRVIVHTDALYLEQRKNT